MGHCGNCRWFNENLCEWWLKPVTSKTRRTTCYVPNDCDPNYPLYPTPTLDNLRRFDYPKPQRRCLVCGTELSGKVALGGAYWDYSNLQTLCRACHAQKTLLDCVEINQVKNQNTEMVGLPSFDTGMIKNLNVPREDHRGDFQDQIKANEPKISSNKSKYRKKLKYMIGKRSRWR